jgi:hypothetical protein
VSGLLGTKIRTGFRIPENRKPQMLSSSDTRHTKNSECSYPSTFSNRSQYCREQVNAQVEQAGVWLSGFPFLSVPSPMNANTFDKLILSIFECADVLVSLFVPFCDKLVWASGFIGTGIRTRLWVPGDGKLHSAPGSWERESAVGSEFLGTEPEIDTPNQ